MKLTEKFWNWAGRKALNSWQRAWLAGSEPAGSGAQLSNALTQVSWVYACVMAKAGKLAQVPLGSEDRPAKDDGRRSAGRRKEDQAVKLPGPMPDFELVQLISMWLDLRGEAFLAGVDPSGGVMRLGASAPAGLLILSPDRMREVTESGELIGWQYSARPGEKIGKTVLLPEEVAHLRLPNPYNECRGLAPLAVASLPAQADFASSQFMKGLMLNNADTGVIVTTDQVLATEQQEQIKAALRERKRSAGSADRPLLLHGGMKLEKPALSSADLQFLENRKFNRQEICAIFQVPQEIIGFTEDANRSVSEQMAANWIHNVIAARARQIAAGLSRLLGREVYFDLDDLPEMQAMRRMRVDTGLKLFGMGVPLNDINDALDLGLPEYAWGEVGMLPYSLQPASAAMEPAAPSAPTSAPPPPAKDQFARAEALLKSLAPRPSPLDPRPSTLVPRPSPLAPRPSTLAPRPSTLDPRPSFHTCAPANPEFEAKLSAESRLTRAKLQRFFFEQRARILSRLAAQRSQRGDPSTLDPRPSPLDARPSTLASGPSSLDPRPSPLASGPSTLDPRPSPLSKSPSLDFDALFDFSTENQKLQTLLKSRLVATFEAGARQLAAELSAVDFTLAPEAAIAFFEKRQNLITGITEDKFAQIKETLQEGLGAGDSWEQLADRVRDEYKSFTDYQAERIAQTETNIALNSGRHEGMVESGVELKAWKASKLENVRATHLDAEQRSLKGIPIDEPFSNGLMYPGDPAGTPEEVINCRCFLVPVLAKP
jgi:HK97 family phage portal protein